MFNMEEDAELEALRLAALATLKSRNSSDAKPEVSTINKIQPINSIARSSNNSSDPGSHNSRLPWRNNVQPLRRRGKVFTKSNPRSSNLIVITPVGAEKEKPGPRNPKASSQLLLPQHKYCQQVNEDSSSPRTERHTGPTRFNRHGSGSESSDSDYEESDDSYSNDTVLQDENSLLSFAETNDKEDKLRNSPSSESRMSFQGYGSLSALDDGEKNYSTSVYKSTLPQNQTETVKTTEKSPGAFINKKSIGAMSNDCNHKFQEDKQSSSVISPVNNKLENGESRVSPKIDEPKSKHTPIKFDMFESGDLQKSINSNDLKKKPSEKLRESSNVFKDLRNHLSNDAKSPENPKNKTSSLSRNDLRYELKRKKEVSVESSALNKLKVNLQHRPNLKRDRSWSRERSRSKERRIHKRSRSRSYSPKHRRRRHRESQHSSSRSNQSSSSLSSSSNSSGNSSPVISRSMSSVVQPVQSKVVVSDIQNNLKSSVNRKSHMSSSGTEFNSVKKPRGIEIKLNPRPNFKISVVGKDSRSNSSEVKKRGPVHMRLGTLPRKRIIQMPKAVEAAFVSTSSDDDTDVNIKCKKSNIVNDLSEKIVLRKEITQRSDVPKANREKFFR